MYYFGYFPVDWTIGNDSVEVKVTKLKTFYVTVVDITLVAVVIAYLLAWLALNTTSEDSFGLKV
jgi:hypothetical protein